MRKILWYAFLLIPAVFTSCNLEDDSGLIPQENRKLTISFSVQDPASGLATRAAIAPEAGEENIKTLDLIFFESNGNGTGTFKGWKELLCIRLSLGDEYRHCVRLFGYRTKNDRCL